jgi:NAD(P)-dependent dehydrogenase (short-subunit alcohol dehydrogenase family)
MRRSPSSFLAEVGPKPASLAARWAGGLAGAALGAWWLVRAIRTRRVSLAGRVALVTGGSRGLGFLVARELIRRGCQVAICARDTEELERARRSLTREAPGHGQADPEAFVLALPCDVSDAGQVNQLVADVVGRFGGLDILVNNAGIIQVGALDTLTLAHFQRAMAVIFWGTVNVTFAALPHLRARRGRIANVTSIGGRVGVPRLLPYDAAKFATYGFSEGLHAELARDGVSVTTVVPGLMRTGSEKFAHFTDPADARWFGVAAQTPGLAMRAERAARRIVAALARRQTRAVLGAPAKLLHLANDLFPSVTSAASSAAHRILPQSTPAR